MAIGVNSIIGPGVVTTVAGTALRNATALTPGKYLLWVGDDSGGTGIHLCFGSSSVTASATTSMRLPGNTFLEFVIPDDPTLQYLSMIRDGSTSMTVYIAGNDDYTAKSTPPSWS